ncbi:MAG: hypothetical protein U0795_00055 [Pirellulales bacterium]
MSILKSLAFTAVTKSRTSPALARRQQLVARLEDQKALFADPGFVRTVKRWKDVDGQRTQVDHRVQIRPWWVTDEKGQTVLLLKYGLRPIEFEKGKSGIVVGAREKVPAVIDAVIAATRSGELDGLLEQSKGQAPATAAKKKPA